MAEGVAGIEALAQIEDHDAQIPPEVEAVPGIGGFPPGMDGLDIIAAAAAAPQNAELAQQTQDIFRRLRLNDPQFIDLPAENPIQMIKDGRSDEFLLWLSQHPDQLDVPDESNKRRTFMHYAAMNQRDEIIEHLFHLGAEMKSDGMGNFPIHYVQIHLPSLHIFIRFEADLNVETVMDQTSPLPLAFIMLIAAKEPEKVPDFIRTLIVGGATLGVATNPLLRLLEPSRFTPYQNMSEDVIQEVRYRIYFEISLTERLFRAMVPMPIAS